MKYDIFWITQTTFTYSSLTIGAMEKDVTYVQS